MYGLARGTSMLVGAGIAGFLLWAAGWFEGTTTPAYWTFVGLCAAAGLVLALAQLVGGWTKWGAPRITGGAFLLGFLPALIVGGWVLLAAQPEGAWMQGTAASWADQLALGGLLETLIVVLPAVAFAIGLLFGYTLDTTGGKVVAAEPAAESEAARPIDEDRRPARERERRVPEEAAAARSPEDEPVRSERAEIEEEEERAERIAEEEYHEPDREVVGSLAGRDRSETRARTDTRETGERGRDRESEERGERRRGWFSRR